MPKNQDEYLDEYRAYVKSFIEDPDADLATLESFNEWLEEEKYEQKIRCRQCGSFNTEQRGKIKHCTDCQHEDTISHENHANWQSPINKEEADRIRNIPVQKRSQAEEIELAHYEKRIPLCMNCLKPLEQIQESQEIDLYWDWDDEKKCYIKSEGDGSSNKPYCSNCGTKDWDLTNNKMVIY